MRSISVQTENEGFKVSISFELLGVPSLQLSEDQASAYEAYVSLDFWESLYQKTVPLLQQAEIAVSESRIASLKSSLAVMKQLSV